MRHTPDSLIRGNAMRTTLRNLTVALLVCLPLLACSDEKPAPAASAEQPTTIIGKAVKKAIDAAREELAKGNIQLDRTGAPGAEITPAGDLLIDGKTIAIDDKQRKLLLDYRGQVVAIASAGMDLGTQGADLAGKAVGQAISGALTGNSEEVEKKIEAEAKKIEGQAVQLCKLLPGLLDAQTRLAAALPAFQPYATMEQKDIDDCGKDGDFNVDIPGVKSTANVDFNGDEQAIRDAVRDEVRETVRTEIRESVRGALGDDNTGMDAAEEAEAAGAEAAPKK
jgi:hypothetical protein